MVEGGAELGFREGKKRKEPFFPSLLLCSFFFSSKQPCALAPVSESSGVGDCVEK